MGSGQVPGITDTLVPGITDTLDLESLASEIKHIYRYGVIYSKGIKYCKKVFYNIGNNLYSGFFSSLSFEINKHELFLSKNKKVINPSLQMK